MEAGVLAIAKKYDIKDKIYVLFSNTFCTIFEHNEEFLPIYFRLAEMTGRTLFPDNVSVRINGIQIGRFP
jgi:hypothetical protein